MCGITVYDIDMDKPHEREEINYNATSIGYLFMYVVYSLIMFVISITVILLGSENAMWYGINFSNVYVIFLIFIMYIRKDVFSVRGLPKPKSYLIFLFEFDSSRYSTDRYLLLAVLAGVLPVYIGSIRSYAGGFISPLLLWGIFISVIMLFPDVWDSLFPIDFKTWTGWTFLFFFGFILNCTIGTYINFH
ncbi:MAG: hypothetical protein ACI4VJ_04480 [Methanosphaera sp.]